MPYPELEQISCKNCGHKISIPPVTVEERYICPECDHVILVKIMIENGGFNKPDSRHLC